MVISAPPATPRHGYKVQPNFDSEEYNARELPSYDFFIRFYVPVGKEKKAHLPSYVKEMFDQLRKCDTSVIMGPMDRKSKNKSLYLYNEKKIQVISRQSKHMFRGTYHERKPQVIHVS